MTSKADEIREKAKRMEDQRKAKAAAAAGGGADPAPASSASSTSTRPTPPTKPVPVSQLPARDTPVAVRGKPIRSTVDLPPTRHHELKSWCDETAIHLGRARVTTQDVMRTLVARLLEDETLSRKIRADLGKGVV